MLWFICGLGCKYHNDVISRQDGIAQSTLIMYNFFRNANIQKIRLYIYQCPEVNRCAEKNCPLKTSRWRPFVKHLQLCFIHLMKSVRIWSFSGLYFPAFRLNREEISVFGPNVEKYRLEKLHMRILFPQWTILYKSSNVTGK